MHRQVLDSSALIGDCFVKCAIDLGRMAGGQEGSNSLFSLHFELNSSSLIDHHNERNFIGRNFSYHFTPIGNSKDFFYHFFALEIQLNLIKLNFKLNVNVKFNA